MVKQESNEKNSTATNVGLLGDYLKQKRLGKNYSLENLSQKTKISLNILRGLEANDYEHLPSAAYIKGFVSSYVKVLGIPLDEAINKMEYTYLNVLGKPFPQLNHTKLMNIPAKKQAVVEEQSPHELIESGDSIIENTKSMLPLFVFAGVILLFVGGYKLISSVIENEVQGQKTKDLGPKIESSSALVNPLLHKNEPSITAAPATEEKQPVQTSDDEEVKPQAQPQVQPEFPRNFPTINFKKVQGPLFSIRTDAPENNDTQLIPEKIKASMKPDLQNVYIKAIEGNTWLSYKIDERPIDSVIISKGSDLYLQGSKIRVFLGNVNVTRIFYNNNLIETPTKTGVKTLIFPTESNENFLMPLFPKAKDDILYTSEEYIKRMKIEEEELKRRQ